MNERLVEDWLTKASERSFQTPFVQSLLAEGLEVVRVGHSPHEHGKDVIAINQNGGVCAYQLKGGSMDLEGLEKHLPQLNALVETPPEHPALTSRKKHIPVLVISGELSIPAADRIRVHNLAWRKRKHPALRIVVGPQLLKRFIALAQDFWPQMPEDSRALLSLYLADGQGSLDRSAFAKLIDSIVGSKDGANRATVLRRISAANVFASYALSGFYNAENYSELVQGWTITAAAIARVAEETGISEKYWASSFRLAVNEATSTLHSLSEEALIDSALWPKTYELDELTRSRCTLCGAAVAARLLISRLSGLGWDGERKAATTLEQLVKGDRLYLWGESAVPLFLTIVWGLECVRGDLLTDGILLKALDGLLSYYKHGRCPYKVYAPHYSADEVVEQWVQVRSGQLKPGEAAKASYTVHVLVFLLARRLWRGFLSARWQLIADVDIVQLIPDAPEDLLRWDWTHSRGSEQSTKHGAPQSWKELLQSCRMDTSTKLPSVLTDHLDFAVLFLLCFPHRLNGDFGLFLDKNFTAI